MNKSNDIAIYLLRCVVLYIISITVSLAGVISISQTTTASIESGVLYVDVQVSNFGDSAAYDVRPRVVFLGDNYVLSKLASLPAGQSVKLSKKIELKENVNGEFHVLSFVGYTDDKGMKHANSAEIYLNTIPILNRFVSQELSVGSFSNTEVRGKFIIKNLSHKLIKIDLKFSTPEMVGVNQEANQLDLKAGETLEVSIILNAKSFKDIGSAPLYIVGLYEIGNVQYSQLSSIPLEVITEDNLILSVFSSKWVIIGAISFLGLILLIVTVINIKRRLRVKGHTNR